MRDEDRAILLVVVAHPHRISSEPNTIEVDLEANYKESYSDAIAHLLDCLASGMAFETSPAGNLETLKIVEQVYVSG